MVEVPFAKKNEDIKTILTLEKDIEITASILFCIRFQSKGNFREGYIFSGENESIALRFDTPLSNDDFGVGFVTINGIHLIFKTLTKLLPYEWHHICFNSNGETYQVMANGVLWYEENYTTKVHTNMTTKSIFLGSNYKKFFNYVAFEGEISELRIWSKSVKKEILTKVVESCDDLGTQSDLVLPTSYILNWSTVSKQMLKGLSEEKPIEWLCYNNENHIDPIYKIISTPATSKNAIRMCKDVKAELAYPKYPGEIQKWSGI